MRWLGLAVTIIVASWGDHLFAIEHVIHPFADGATASAWWWSGHSTREFLEGMYLGGGTDSQGRAALLDSIVDDGSGKLNVMIFEGLNDRWRTENSPEYFRDSVSALIEAVRADWAAAARRL